MRAKRKPYNIKPMQPGGRPCRACVILRTLSGGCVRVSFPMNGELEITARPLRGLLYMFYEWLHIFTLAWLWRGGRFVCLYYYDVHLKVLCWVWNYCKTLRTRYTNIVFIFYTVMYFHSHNYKVLCQVWDYCKTLRTSLYQQCLYFMLLLFLLLDYWVLIYLLISRCLRIL